MHCTIGDSWHFFRNICANTHSELKILAVLALACASDCVEMSKKFVQLLLTETSQSSLRIQIISAGEADDIRANRDDFYLDFCFGNLLISWWWLDVVTFRKMKLVGKFWKRDRLNLSVMNTTVDCTAHSEVFYSGKIQRIAKLRKQVNKMSGRNKLTISGYKIWRIKFQESKFKAVIVLSTASLITFA